MLALSAPGCVQASVLGSMWTVCTVCWTVAASFRPRSSIFSDCRLSIEERKNPSDVKTASFWAGSVTQRLTRELLGQPVWCCSARGKPNLLLSSWVFRFFVLVWHHLAVIKPPFSIILLDPIVCFIGCRKSSESGILYKCIDCRITHEMESVIKWYT